MIRPNKDEALEPHMIIMPSKDSLFLFYVPAPINELKRRFFVKSIVLVCAM